MTPSEDFVAAVVAKAFLKEGCGAFMTSSPSQFNDERKFSNGTRVTVSGFPGDLR
jgi:hypothetical protein